MKNAAVNDAIYADSNMSMHTKQLAEFWKIDSRSLTNWVAKVRKLGYEIGQPGERNRTYFNDVDQDLINACRHGTLTPNPRKAEVTQNDSENVLSMEERRNREAQEAQTESDQNQNLALRTAVIQESGSLLSQRTEAGYQEGSAIAKAELASKVKGYLETRVEADKAFNDFINQMIGDYEQLDEQCALPEVTTPKQLIASLF
ncbi:hypothetical protein ACKFKH_32350 [Phormidesmis sp. 146-20]